MTEKLITYFSFGHNTNLKELQKRIPDAQLLGAAELHGYRFVMKNFADIVPDKDSLVHGVLWGLPADELDQLDWDEAYGKHYKHKIVTVEYHDKKVKALTYVMLTNYKSDNPPSVNYINWISQGYRDNRIPLTQLIKALDNRLKELKN